VLKNVHKIVQLALSVFETPRLFACRSNLASASRIIPSFAWLYSLKTLRRPVLAFAWPCDRPRRPRSTWSHGPTSRSKSRPKRCEDDRERGWLIRWRWSSVQIGVADRRLGHNPFHMGLLASKWLVVALKRLP